MTYDPRAPFGHLSNTRPPGADPDGDPSAEHPDATDPTRPKPAGPGTTPDGRPTPAYDGRHATGDGHGDTGAYGQPGPGYAPTTPGDPATSDQLSHGYGDRHGGTAQYDEASHGYGGAAPHGQAPPPYDRTGSGYGNDPTTPRGPAIYGQQGYTYDDRSGGGGYGNDPTTPGGPAGYGQQGYGYEDRASSGGYGAEGYGGTAPYGQAPPGPEPTRPTEPAGYGQSDYGGLGSYGGTAPYGQPAPGYDPTRPGYEQAGYEQAGYGQPPGYGPPPAGYGYEQPSYGQGVRPPVPPPSGMSTAALVLGILGVLTGLIPLLFFVAFPLGVLALVLGLIAYTRGKRLGVGQGRAGSWLGGIAVVLSIVGLAIVADAFDDLDDATSSSSGNPDEPAVSSGDDGEQDVFAVGQTAHTGDFDVTLHTVTDPFTPASQFERPQANNRFVAVEVEVTNTSNENQVMSTLAGAELTDSQNRGWNIAIAGTDLPQLDGQVPPGDARRGWVVFEVAQDATDLQLRIKGNLTATGSLFDLG